MSWQNKQFNSDNMEKSYLWDEHPANVIRIEFNKQIAESDYYIFTDGSQVGNQVGAAFLICDKTNKIIHSEMFKLPDHNNNFISEVIA